MQSAQKKPVPAGSSKAAGKQPSRARSDGKKYKVEHVVVPLKSGQPKKG